MEKYKVTLELSKNDLIATLVNMGENDKNTEEVLKIIDPETNVDPNEVFSDEQKSVISQIKMLTSTMLIIQTALNKKQEFENIHTNIGSYGK